MTEYLPGATGERITELREDAGLTIEELAAKIDVNATTLGRMERGQTQKIGDDVLTALAREFNVSTDFLLGLTSIPDRKNTDILDACELSYFEPETARVFENGIERLFYSDSFRIGKAVLP